MQVIMQVDPGLAGFGDQGGLTAVGYIDQDQFKLLLICF